MNKLGLAFLLTVGALGIVAASDRELIVAQYSFADALTSELYSKENECTSAWGVSMAFDLIYPSSTGETRQDMEEVFGFSTPSTTATARSQYEEIPSLQWDDIATRMRGIYQGECLPSGRPSGHGGNSSTCQHGQDPLVAIANSIWVNHAITLNPSYAQVVGAYARQIDFSDTGAAAIINDWVEQETYGLIDSIVEQESLGPDVVLIAVNTLYLKASWTRPFRENNTNEDVFYTSVLRDTPTDSPARFMHTVGTIPYAHTAEHQILKLPFAGGSQRAKGLSMVFVLPITQDTVLSSVDLITQLPLLQEQRVAIGLPRFKYESEYKDSLMAALQSIGLVAPFRGGLCIEQGSCSTFVDLVVQKTVIDVNERGVEAAAATMVRTRRSANRPVLFLADHPFQFFILDENEEVFLFEGQVGNPGIPEDAPADAQLDAKHTDEDFWTANFRVDPIEV